MKRLLLILAAGLFLPCAANVDSLKADTLARWIASGPPFSFVLIDVRETSELSSVIGTAACRPYTMAWNSGVLRAQYQLVPKTAPVVVYCASGHRSGPAAEFLDSLGYAAVYALVNGFGAWTGPTQSPSNLRPLSDLPAFSMTAPAAAAVPGSGRRTSSPASAGVHRELWRNGIILTQRNMLSGEIERYDCRGTRLGNRGRP